MHLALALFTPNWRSAFLGAALAALTLAALVAIFGVTLVKFIPLEALRLVIGVILVMFGMKWLKKALLRYSGRKALHDEEAIYEEEQRALKAHGETLTQKIDGFGVATSYKSVLLEGLEVAFIVVTFGLTVSKNQSIAAQKIAQTNSLTSAIIGAVIAGLLVVALGALVRAPLTRIPENTLKFVVGIMLTSFGTFWGGEGLGIEWPRQDVFLLVLIGIYLLASFAAVQVLRPSTTTQATVPAAQE
jgi:Ca2+/H+ antiporter, TMEM165/GDT1 family